MSATQTSLGRTGEGRFPQPVGGYRLVVITPGGVGHKAPFLAGVEMRLAHQPGDAVLAAVLALSLQRGLDARTAIGTTVGLEDQFDLLDQFLVILCASTGRLLLVRVISAGADFQGLGQFLDLILGFQLVHKLEASLRCPSETMAKAFLRCPYGAGDRLPLGAAGGFPVTLETGSPGYWVA